MALVFSSNFQSIASSVLSKGATASLPTKLCLLPVSGRPADLIPNLPFKVHDLANLCAAAEQGFCHQEQPSRITECPAWRRTSGYEVLHVVYGSLEPPLPHFAIFRQSCSGSIVVVLQDPEISAKDLDDMEVDIDTFCKDRIKLLLGDGIIQQLNDHLEKEDGHVVLLGYSLGAILAGTMSSYSESRLRAIGFACPIASNHPNWRNFQLKEERNAERTSENDVLLRFSASSADMYLNRKSIQTIATSLTVGVALMIEASEVLEQISTCRDERDSRQSWLQNLADRLAEQAPLKLLSKKQVGKYINWRHQYFWEELYTKDLTKTKRTMNQYIATERDEMARTLRQTIGNISEALEPVINNWIETWCDFSIDWERHTVVIPHFVPIRYTMSRVCGFY